MNKITEKWKKTGLLEESEEIDKLALLLEDLKDILIEEDSDKYSMFHKMDKLYYNGFVAGSILPILVMVYREHNDICPTDMKWFYEDFIKYINENHQLYLDLTDPSNIAFDGQAEFVWSYINQFKGKV